MATTGEQLLDNAPAAEDPRLQAARSGDREAFERLTEPYRHELQVHCYRMLGSLMDAEDVVQDTLLKAWRKLNTYQARAPLRAWLYRIATNTCLDALSEARRRGLPAEFFPEAGRAAEALPPVTEPIWIEPFPDACLAPTPYSPEARYEAREAITLAFVAALQSLPPRQRAVLILRDVLGWGIAEVAALLAISPAAVHSALYRARRALERSQHGKDLARLPAAPSDLEQEQLLARYLQAWEAADVDGLVQLLKEDASFSMPPLPFWCRGRPAIRDFVERYVLDGEAGGRWKLLPIRASGQPAFGWFRREPGQDSYTAFAIQVIDIRAGQVADVTTFGFPMLFPFFGLPVMLGG
jgi:RNA polymerase sigma-70 factor (ECF subfamily)